MLANGNDEDPDLGKSLPALRGIDATDVPPLVDAK